MSKNTICSYTRETGTPKTYEDSSWSTRTEIILVKTRCTAKKILPDSPKIHPKLYNASTLSLVPEALEELPLLGARKKVEKRKMAWAALENSDNACCKNVDRNEMCKAINDQCSVLLERRSRTSNREVSSKRNCRDFQNDHLSRPSTARKINGKSKSLNRPKEVHNHLAEEKRHNSASSFRSHYLVKPGCIATKESSSLEISRQSFDQKLLPSIASGKSEMKRFHETGWKLELTDKKPCNGRENFEQIRRKLEHIKITNDYENIHGGNGQDSANHQLEENQKYTTVDCPLIQLTEVDNNFMKSTLFETENAAKQNELVANRSQYTGGKFKNIMMKLDGHVHNRSLQPT